MCKPRLVLVFLLVDKPITKHGDCDRILTFDIHSKSALTLGMLLGLMLMLVSLVKNRL